MNGIVTYHMETIERPFFYKNEDFVVGEKYNTLLVERAINSPKWPNEVYTAVQDTEYYAGTFVRFQMHETGRHDDRTCSYFFLKEDGSEHVVWLDYSGRTRFRLVSDKSENIRKTLPV